MNGDAGVVVTPSGSPVMETVTVLLNPLIGSTETCVLPPPPPMGMDSDCGDRLRLKSSVVGGAEPELPQAIKRVVRQTATAVSRMRIGRHMGLLLDVVRIRGPR